MLRRLFEPLAYEVTALKHPLDTKFSEWGESRYFTVSLKATVRLNDLLTHLYVLIPVLDDDKHFQQAGNVVPVMRSDKLDDNARSIINKVSAALTTDQLIDLNKSVQVDKEDPKAAAEKFLKDKGLL